MATTLRYPYEVRNAKDHFDDIPDIKVVGDMLKLAEQILETKAADFDPMQFVDHYEEAVIEMLKEKQAGLPMQKERAASAPVNVVNLMDALRRSIADSRGRTAPRPKKGKNRIEGQREMLLAISGEGGKQNTKKLSRVRPLGRRKRVRIAFWSIGR